MEKKIRVRYQFLVLLLIPLGLALYLYALRAPFVYDDRGYILQNQSIRSLSNFLDLSGTRYIGFLSFAVNYSIGGLTPFDYHLVNVLIHIINSILVFFLVTSVFDTPLLKKFSAGADDIKTKGVFLAFISSVIFISHPLETQAVTYVTQRFASLATMFYLLAVLLYSRARITMEAAGQGAAGQDLLWKKRLFYLASLASTVLAMKTKEISFTIPFVIAAYDYIFFSSWRDKKVFRLHIPFYLTLFIIPLTLLGPELWGTHASGVTEDLRKLQMRDAGVVPRYTYTLTQFSVIVTYIRLLFFPAGQQIDYDYPFSHSLFEPRAFSSFIFLLSILAGSIYILARSYRNRNFYGIIFSFGIFWFFITLSVESFMVPIQDVIFEHRAYLPSVGFIISFTAALMFLWDRLKKRFALGISDSLAACLMLLVICPPLFFLSYQRNRVWCDELGLLNSAIERSPGKSRLYYARAGFYIEEKEYGKAIVDATEAISANYKSADAYNIRGIAYSHTKRFKESIEDFTRALMFNPSDHMAYYNRGLSHEALKDYDRAIGDFTEAIRLNSDFADAYNNRGVVYSIKGDMKSALRDVADACVKGSKKGCENLKTLIDGAKSR